MAEYSLLANGIIQRNADKALIPPNSDLRDYRNYLKWVEAGGVPDPYVPPPLPIKQECLRRIRAAVDTDALVLLIGLYMASALTTNEQLALRDGVNWVKAMRAAAKTLIQNNDADYANDAKWVTVPSNFTALVAAYS